MVVADVALAAQMQATTNTDVGIDVMQLDGSVTPGADAVRVVELFVLDDQVVASQYFAVVAVVDAQALLVLVINAEFLGAADLFATVICAGGVGTGLIGVEFPLVIVDAGADDVKTLLWLMSLC